MVRLRHQVAHQPTAAEVVVREGHDAVVGACTVVGVCVLTATAASAALTSNTELRVELVNRADGNDNLSPVVAVESDPTNAAFPNLAFGTV